MNDARKAFWFGAVLAIGIIPFSILFVTGIFWPVVVWAISIFATFYFGWVK